ncbi:MAG: DUF4136 domain-containing protein [Woeseiaceae bacterium]
MTRSSGVLLPLAALTLMAACQSNPRVQSDIDDGVDFGAYKTYDFGGHTEAETTDLSSTLEMYFKAAVAQQLLMKGLTKSDDPDILINVQVDIGDVSRAPVNGRNCPRYEDYYSRHLASTHPGKGRRPMCIYSEGTVEVDLVDVEPGVQILKGVSRVRLDKDDRGDLLLLSVTYDVATMFGESVARNGQPVFSQPATLTLGTEALEINERIR